MAAHLARSTKRRPAGVLVIALGVGVLAFAFFGGDDPEAPSVDRARSSTSDPTVLGVVITPDDTPPTAEPASPATFDTPGRASTTTRGTTATTSTTAPPPSLIPPTGIENTTTTTERPSPTTIDLSTTTTEPTPSSTGSTTTEPPAP